MYRIYIRDFASKRVFRVELLIPLVINEDPGIWNLCPWDMDSTRGRWTTLGGFPHEVPTPNRPIHDPSAGPHQELRGRSAHRSRPGVGSHKTPSEFCLRWSSVTWPGFPKIRQHSKHSGVMLIWLSAILPSRAGSVVQVVRTTEGSTSSAGTTMTPHQLTCGEDPPCMVIQEWR